jgi:hypothetical protein
VRSITSSVVVPKIGGDSSVMVQDESRRWRPPDPDGLSVRKQTSSSCSRLMEDAGILSMRSQGEPKAERVIESRSLS